MNDATRRVVHMFYQLSYNILNLCSTLNKALEAVKSCEMWDVQGRQMDACSIFHGDN